MKALLFSFLASSMLAPVISGPAWSQDGPISLLPSPAPASPAPASPAPASSAGLASAPRTIPGTPTDSSTATVRTTTESGEYCSELQDRVDSMVRGAKTPAAEQALSLSQEGERLCKHGKTRSGILHLRRAFILIRPPEGSH